MKTILLLLITLLFISCANPWSRENLIINKIEQVDIKEGKYALYFKQNGGLDFVLYTNKIYKVGDTLK